MFEFVPYAISGVSFNKTAIIKQDLYTYIIIYQVGTRFKFEMYTSSYLEICKDKKIL